MPEDLHDETGLVGGGWSDHVAGPDSLFAAMEAAVCADYCEMERLRDEYFAQRKGTPLSTVSAAE